MVQQPVATRRRFSMGFTTQMIIASVLGLIAGVVFGDAMANIKFIGDIFLRLMQMAVVLLVLGAIIEAVGALSPRDLGKLGGKTLAIFVTTTAIAAAFGLGLALLIKPGVGVTGVEAGEYKGTLAEGAVTDMVTQVFPKNVFESMATGNMLQVIIFAAFVGLAVSLMSGNEHASRVFDFIKSMNAVLMQLIKIVLKTAPVGVFALLAGIVGKSGLEILVPLGKFLIALTVGCVIFFLAYVAIAAMYGRVNPIQLLKNMQRTIVVAVTTTSSAASLPVQLEDSEERMGISYRVSRLVNPLGMPLNSDGLGMTVAIACIMVAQFFGIDLSAGELVMIVVISTVATFANLAVPGGALVTMAIAFQMAGLPLEGIALIAGVDWFAGIIRTLLNVADDVLTAFVVAVSEKEFDRDRFNRPISEKGGGTLTQAAPIPALVT